MSEPNPTSDKPGLKDIRNAIGQGVKNAAKVTKDVAKQTAPTVKNTMKAVRDSIEKEAPVVLDAIKKTGVVMATGLEKASQHAQQWWDGKQTTPLLNNFCSNNVVALKSRNTEKCVQLTVDANLRFSLSAFGEDSSTANNTHWTVINLGKNIVRLHNNNKFICISQAGACITEFPVGTEPAREADLRLSVQDNTFVAFESVHYPNMRLAFSSADGGLVKDALRYDKTAHFSCRIVSSPYQQ